MIHRPKLLAKQLNSATFYPSILAESFCGGFRSMASTYLIHAALCTK